MTTNCSLWLQPLEYNKYAGVLFGSLYLRLHLWPACHWRNNEYSQLQGTFYSYLIRPLNCNPYLLFTERIGRTVCAAVSRLLCGFRVDGNSRRKGLGKNLATQASNWSHKDTHWEPSFRQLLWMRPYTRRGGHIFQEKHTDPHHGGRCSPVPRHVQRVSRLLLRLVGSFGLNLLSSQTAVDLDGGDRNEEKRAGNDWNNSYTPLFSALDECKSKEHGKSPYEGEHCTNSPGRYSLLILEDEEQSSISVQDYRSQSPKRSNTHCGPGDSVWPEKWTRHQVRINRPKE